GAETTTTRRLRSTWMAAPAISIASSARSTRWLRNASIAAAKSSATALNLAAHFSAAPIAPTKRASPPPSTGYESKERPEATTPGADAGAAARRGTQDEAAAESGAGGISRLREASGQGGIDHGRRQRHRAGGGRLVCARRRRYCN